MMGERTVAQEGLFYSFSLERHVPADHLLRWNDRFVDLSSLREHLRPFYRAVTVEHGGRKPREPKLGKFKLDGLTDVQPTKKLFANTIFPDEPSEVRKGLSEVPVLS